MAAVEGCWPPHHCTPAGARETVRLLPPLTVSADEMEEGLSIFEDCLQEVFG